jgi:2'-5' RNA ligase
MHRARRCIYLCADDLDPRIQSFREQYDPLAKLIEPHITLVFPVESNATDEELVAHVSHQVSSDSSFDASLETVPTSHGDYIYLQIVEGFEQIGSMHDRLYKGFLRPLLLDIPYVPHITIARVARVEHDKLMAEAASLEFRTRFRIGNLKIERVLDSGRGELIGTISLRSGI